MDLPCLVHAARGAASAWRACCRWHSLTPRPGSSFFLYTRRTMRGTTGSTARAFRGVDGATPRSSWVSGASRWYAGSARRALCLLFAIAVIPGSEAATAGSGEGGTADARAAAERGLAYLIGQFDGMPPTWRLAVFPVLGKLLPEGEAGDRCRALARAALRSPVAELPDAFEPNDLRWPRTFRPQLAELVRRQDLGQPDNERRDRLARAIRDHEDKLLEKLNPTQTLVTLYQLERLGIQTQLSRAEVRDRLRARWRSEPRTPLLANAQFMFGLTHVVLIDSGYFERKLGQAGRDFEVEALEAAVEQYAQGLPPGKMFLDVAAEVLLARRLLGMASSPASQAVVAKLVELQQADGRWGEKRFQHDVHASFVSVAALAEWVDPFRPAVRGPAFRAEAQP